MLFLSIPSLIFFILTLEHIHISPFKFFNKTRSVSNRENRLSLFFVILWFFLFHSFVLNIKNETVLSNPDELVGSNPNFVNISKIVMQQTNLDDYIVVWGREPRINVYTNRRSATTATDIDRLLWGDQYRAAFFYKKYPQENINKYIHDIKTNKPKLIVDMVAPGSYFYHDEVYALENHAEIWTAIKDDYELTTVYPVEGGSYKIYTRKN
jgi:hypothetical protein